MLCPTTSGRAAIPPATAAATTSSAQLSMPYAGRRPLSPCPDRSSATTRWLPAKNGATWSHQPEWAAPPCTNTSPGRSSVPQQRRWIDVPATVVSRCSGAIASAARNHRGRSCVCCTGRTLVDPAVGAGPGAVAEHVLLDLAGGRLRKRAERHRLRCLEPGQPAADVLDDLGLGGGGTVLQGDVRGRHLAPALVRHRDHRHLEHRRMVGDGLLDL